MRKDIIIIDDDRDLCTLLQESLLQENILCRYFMQRF